MTSFRQPQVKAIQKGLQTQHRVPLRVQPPKDSRLIYDSLDCYEGEGYAFQYPKDIGDGLTFNAIFELPNKGKPKYQPGDIMVVRERARCIMVIDYPSRQRGQFKYEADGKVTGLVDIPERIKSLKNGHCVPNGCFKELARIKRKVKRVWYERVQDISRVDAQAEGCDEYTEGDAWFGPEVQFCKLWESIYPGSWERNDWVECIEFEGVNQ
jgi:hypothetical protein